MPRFNSSKDLNIELDKKLVNRQAKKQPDLNETLKRVVQRRTQRRF